MRRPPHLREMGEIISEAITFLAERWRRFYYYIWDIDRAYRHGVDGRNLGPGEQQLPRPNGTIDHTVLPATLKRIGYEGAASLKCHETRGWPLEKVTSQLRSSDAYIKDCLARNTHPAIRYIPVTDAPLVPIVLAWPHGPTHPFVEELVAAAARTHSSGLSR